MSVGYANYQDPRLQPPEEPESDTCSDCAYYREVYCHQRSNGITHFIGVCIFEVANADNLAEADLVEVDPEDEPCGDYKEVQ